jgi:hypothetical protein
MSKSNDMIMRATLREDGSIAGFLLRNYGGGGDTEMFLYRLKCGEFYWVLDGDGFHRTMFFKFAFYGGTGDYTDHDLDELGLEALYLVHTDGLEEQDARMRALIAKKSDEELPRRIPTPQSKLLSDDWSLPAVF